MIKGIRLAKDSGGGHILNALFHGKQKKAGKYVIPHETADADADAPVLVKADRNWPKETLLEESLAAADMVRAATEFGVSCEDMFYAIDENGDGILTREALKRFFAEANLSMSDEEFERQGGNSIEIFSLEFWLENQLETEVKTQVIFQAQTQAKIVSIELPTGVRQVS